MQMQVVVIFEKLCLVNLKLDRSENLDILSSIIHSKRNPRRHNPARSLEEGMKVPSEPDKVEKRSLHTKRA